MEKLKIKILGLSCSNRLKSDIGWMVQYGLKAIDKFGRRLGEVADFETEFIELADKDLKPCINCLHRPCIAGGGRPDESGGAPVVRGCPVKDYHQALGPKFQESDGLLLGVPTSLGSFNSRFRMLWEAMGRGQPSGKHFLHSNRLPVGVMTCADTGPGAGTETCLNDAHTAIRFIEMMPVNFSQGPMLFRNPSWDPVPEGMPLTVKNNRHIIWRIAIASRRVAEYAVMLKLTKRELGEIFTREFMQRNHPPWGKKEIENWAWTRLDKEDHEYMMNLPIENLRVNR